MNYVLIALIPIALFAMSSKPQNDQDQKNPSSPPAKKEAPKTTTPTPLNEGDREMLEEESDQNFNQTYTERDSKIGFGLTRKLPRFNDLKLPNISKYGAA